jgi:Tol biopolymer transport system component
MNSDGSDKKQITYLESNNYYPFFSPDGLKLVFMSNLEKTIICTIKTDGTEFRQLTDANIENADPHWSPDGSQIIFYSERDGNAEIYIMNGDGTDPKRITNHEASDQTPSFSPDGQKVVFVSNRDGDAELYLMNGDGTDTKRITNDPRVDRVPSWSPDGQKIIWYAREPSTVAGSGAAAWKGAEIYEMKIDGTERRQLTQNLYRDHGPVYSPDGTKIAFTSTKSGIREVYVMDIDGQNVTQLTFSQ